jgi:hypothetical protein
MSEFDYIGKSCSLCGVLDFLPIQCGRCHLDFCNVHGIHHECSGVVASVPVTDHVAPKKEVKCENGCRRTITLSNSANCPHCDKKICLKCQFDHSEKCLLYLKKLEDEKQSRTSRLVSENTQFHTAMIKRLTDGNEKILHQKRIILARQAGATLTFYERQLQDAIVYERDSCAKIIENDEQMRDCRTKLSEIQKAKMALEKKQRGGEVIENYDKYIEALNNALQSRQKTYDNVMRCIESAKVAHSENIRKVEILKGRVAEEKKKAEDDVRFLEESDALVAVISKYIDIISKTEPATMDVKRRKELITEFTVETSTMPVDKFVFFG